VFYSQSAYGLRIATTGIIPGLALNEESAGSDIEIHLNDGTELPHPSSCELLYTSENLDRWGSPLLRVGRLHHGAYIFSYSDGVRFAIDSHGREIVAGWPEGYALEDAATYLTGPVLAFALRLRGWICLHASAVAIEDRAIALVGSPGAGKSTTSAAFAKNGYAVLSDDVVALADEGDSFRVQPGYPRVNLWPDAVSALFGSEDVLPRITPTWDKRFLPLDEARFRFESRALPLSVVYVLGPREPGRSACRIGPVSPPSAVIALVANTYLNYLLDKEMRSSEFGVLARLVNQVTVRFIEPPDAAFRLSEVVDEICADAQEVPSAPVNSC
jgi:hypothetical protein